MSVFLRAYDYTPGRLRCNTYPRKLDRVAWQNNGANDNETI